jgi:uncharacterized protein YjcR
MSDKTDIVERLRAWADTICTIRGEVTPGSKSRMALDAADEIERLRVQALGTQRRIQDQDAIMAELWERIHAITAEREALAAELAHRNADLDRMTVHRNATIAHRDITQQVLNGITVALSRSTAERDALRAERDEARRDCFEKEAKP